MYAAHLTYPVIIICGAPDEPLVLTGVPVIAPRVGTLAAVDAPHHPPVALDVLHGAHALDRILNMAGLLLIPLVVSETGQDYRSAIYCLSSCHYKMANPAEECRAKFLTFLGFVTFVLIYFGTRLFHQVFRSI